MTVTSGSNIVGKGYLFCNRLKIYTTVGRAMKKKTGIATKKVFAQFDINPVKKTGYIWRCVSVNIDIITVTLAAITKNGTLTWADTHVLNIFGKY